MAGFILHGIEESVEKSEKTNDSFNQTIWRRCRFRIGAIKFTSRTHYPTRQTQIPYNFGQNILEHSLEVAYLMGMMAEELGLNCALARRIGLLHDIGKAVTHEVQGSHAIIGHHLALKYGESPAVANGIGAHHHEMVPETVEGSSTQTELMQYQALGLVYALKLQRSIFGDRKKLETSASQFTGVEKAYALQAGREIRVIALPDQLNDEEIFSSCA